MKLVNPTDGELNQAFAERVAGWYRCERMGKQVLYDPEGGHVLIGDARCMPKFSESADLVLPWLQKMNYVASACPVSGNEHHHCIITIHTWHTAEKLGDAYASTFAKAAVIALLRAHGVEVEITL